MEPNLLYAVSEGVCRITLNRPQVYHALNAALLRALTEAIERAGADEAVRVVVLTGAGDQAFCSGADLKEGAEPLQAGEPLALGSILQQGYNPLIRAIRNGPKPVICRLNGAAVGAGCSLALACDLIIAADGAYLALLFVEIGLLPDAGATFFLPRLVGTQKAFELASTGRRVYGPEAERLGLISRSVPRGELDETVDELARYYVTAPTQAIGALKQAFNQSWAASLEQQLDHEAALQDRLGGSHDAVEGLTAFLEKRKAAFTGK